MCFVNNGGSSWGYIGAQRFLPSCCSASREAMEPMGQCLGSVGLDQEGGRVFMKLTPQVNSGCSLQCLQLGLEWLQHWRVQGLAQSQSWQMADDFHGNPTWDTKPTNQPLGIKHSWVELVFICLGRVPGTHLTNRSMDSNRTLVVRRGGHKLHKQIEDSVSFG
jgi:hypothetical protein